MTNKDAFSLIEIMVAIMIMGLIAAVSIPAFRAFRADPKKDLVQNLNSLSLSALNNAVFSGNTNRVLFDFKKNKIIVEEQLTQKGSDGQVQYEKLSKNLGATEIDFDTAKLAVANFFINGKDEMELSGSEVAKNTVWFFVSPEGVAQNVTINLNELEYDSDNQFSLVLNPFTVQFKEDDKHVFPK